MMHLRRFLDLRAPIFVFGILAIMNIIFPIGLGIDRLVTRLRETQSKP